MVFVGRGTEFLLCVCVCVCVCVCLLSLFFSLSHSSGKRYLSMLEKVDMYAFLSGTGVREKVSYRFKMELHSSESVCGVKTGIRQKLLDEFQARGWLC